MDPNDIEFIRSLHQKLRVLQLVKDQQEKMIKEAQEFEIVTDPLEIEKAFREDDL